MDNAQLEVAGVTLVKNERGVVLEYGWLLDKQISATDAVRIRDWLNVNFPVKLCKCVD